MHTCTSTKPPYGSIIARTSLRVLSYGAMGAQSAMPPFLVISEATYPMRRMFRSRCAREKPSSDDRCLRTRSPSSSVTLRPPRSRNLTSRTLAIVDFPAPDNPVKKIVRPCCRRGGWLRRSSAATSGKVNHSGISLPCDRRLRSSVPERLSTVLFGGTSSSGTYRSSCGTYTIVRNGTISIPISS